MRRGGIEQRQYFRVEAGPAVANDAIGVVEFARAIDAEADEKSVLLEECSPLFGEQGAIGLRVVLDAPAGLLILQLQRNGFVEELEESNVGSPPCQEKTTSSRSWPSMYWRM